MSKCAQLDSCQHLPNVVGVLDLASVAELRRELHLASVEVAPGMAPPTFNQVADTDQSWMAVRKVCCQRSTVTYFTQEAGEDLFSSP